MMWIVAKSDNFNCVTSTYFDGMVVYYKKNLVYLILECPQ